MKRWYVTEFKVNGIEPTPTVWEEIAADARVLTRAEVERIAYLRAEIEYQGEAGSHQQYTAALKNYTQALDELFGKEQTNDCKK